MAAGARLQEVIAHYLERRRANGPPLSMRAATAAISSELGTPASANRELETAIAAAALRRGMALHFDRRPTVRDI